MTFRTSFRRFFPFLILLFCCACGNRKNAGATFHTNMGDIRVRLFDSTPGHRDHFLSAFKHPSADTLECFRVERDFAIQFGTLPGNTSAAPDLKPEIEAPLRGGALVAALADSNNGSHGARFFIAMDRQQTDASLDAIEKKQNLHFTPEERIIYKKYGGLPQLHGQYTVFGEVTEGMEVAQKIAALPRDANGRPLVEVRVRVEIGE